MFARGVFSSLLVLSVHASPAQAHESGILQRSTAPRSTPVEKLALEQNPKEYCNRKMQIRYLQSKPANDQYYGGSRYSGAEIDVLLESGNLQRAVDSEVERDLKSVEETFDSFHVWHFALIPSQRAKRIAGDRVFILDTQSRYTVPITRNEALSLLDQPLASLPFHSKFISVRRVEHKDRYKISEDLDLAKQYACMELLGPFRALECSKPMETVSRITTGNIGLTGREIYDEVSQTHLYEEGLINAAKKISGHYAKGKPPEGSSLFEDLKASFVLGGASFLEAEERSWNVLGLLATGGANFSGRSVATLKSKEDLKTYLSLSLIATAIPLLDFNSSTEGRTYSLPKEVVAGCDTSKSYHFWYTAYLARRAALESGKPEASAASAYQAAKAYHVLEKPLLGMSPTATIFGDDLHSPTSQIVRADLAYAGAGAVYGANRAGDRDVLLSVDDTLAGLIETAGEGEASFATKIASIFKISKATYYSVWIKKYNANLSFDLNRAHGFPDRVNTDYLE